MEISQSVPSLTKEEAEVIAIVFQNPTRRQVIKLLLEKEEPLYHNEIHSVLGGSKSTIHTQLSELRLKDILIREQGFKTSSSKILVDLYIINPKYLPLLKKCQGLL